MFRTEATGLQMTSGAVDTVTRSPDETRLAGRQLSRELRGGEVVLVHGVLGAGKTVFVSGLAAGLGAQTWRGSPTFALVNEYETSPYLVHVDLYRLSEAEAETLGLEEYARRDSVLVSEWPERAAPYMRSLASRAVIDVWLEALGPEERALRVVWSPRGAA
jgi:tRNA threonylcarbamoyladenosine biosynthesis protein TsaE